MTSTGCVSLSSLVHLQSQQRAEGLVTADSSQSKLVTSSLASLMLLPSSSAASVSKCMLRSRQAQPLLLFPSW